MSIKNFAWLGAAALCGLMAILTLTAVFGINHIRLGGSLSHSNQLVSDFKADVTPPPTYLVEAFALANVMGKGFAVVAGEVRALAQRCAEAADEVKSLISASSAQVTRGVDLVGRSGDAFAAITQDITALSGAIQALADSAASQAESLAQITTAAGELDRSTQHNAAMAEQCTAAATSLTREAGLLDQALARFTVSAAPPPVSLARAA